MTIVADVIAVVKLIVELLPIIDKYIFAAEESPVAKTGADKKKFVAEEVKRAIRETDVTPPIHDVIGDVIDTRVKHFNKTNWS